MGTQVMFKYKGPLDSWMQLLHMSVPLHLRFVAIDAPFRLASERKEIRVEELGRQAVAGVLLGSLDVHVDLALRLESLTAALVGAGEWTLARVIHLVQLQSMSVGESR